MSEHNGSRFVRPETVTIPISRGDTLTVRKRLNAGERRAAYARMYIQGEDGRLRVNALHTGIALVVAYLLDWSLVDDDGRRVEIRALSAEDLTRMLDALDPESFQEIKEAIEAHDAAIAAALPRPPSDQEKKPIPPAPSAAPESLTTGAPAPDPISTFAG